MADALSRTNPATEAVDDVGLDEPVETPAASSINASAVNAVIPPLPPATEFRSLQDADPGLANWIEKHRVSDTPFKPEVVDDVWCDRGKVLVPSSLQRQ
ncbi:Hypothetical predicted protein, partial [Paramuricea clavata]